MITVVIPVGPEKHHAQYLDECLESVYAQIHSPDEILIIDDMNGIELEETDQLHIWRSPWRLGVAHAFNFGIALARNECVFTLGADDKLLPQCLEKCIERYHQEKESDGWYFVPVQYNDGREQNLACHAAMVTKGLWRKTGGLPPETASGASDAAFISMSMTSMSKVCKVFGVWSEPLYWYRIHDKTDTASRYVWQGVILETRNILSKTWTPPQWGRYE